MAMNLDLNNVMEFSLPSSNDSTRPGSPKETNCERLISIKNDIEKFSIVVENTKAGLKTLLFVGIPQNDPMILDHNRRLEEYQRLRQLAVSEFTSQPYCKTPGCTIHDTPSCSPVKSTQNITKTNAIKRKENEDGYISPSSRQTAKKRRTTPVTENNFKIDLRNKFDNLRIEQATGPSLTETVNSQSNDTLNKTTKPNTVTTTKGNTKFLPPPIFLEISNEYRHQMKVLNNKFPILRMVTSSIPVPLKTRRVGHRCTLNLSRAETSSRWCGVVVRRGGCQLRCRPRHLTMVQNYVVRRQKPSCS
ncbi:uncharacterized protein TNCV_75821 [Trichonephila clavipes]|nr:uncharacterized protein TNCV_75821 [Trichonephila clavipes]